MSAGKVVLHIIAAGGLLGITFGFFWAIGFLDGFLGGFYVVTYATTVWIMSGVLAFLIVLSAIAKDHARLELLSSGGFLVFVILAYTVGCSILSVFIPYSGFGQLNVQLMANIGAFAPLGISSIDMTFIALNTMGAWFVVGAQALRFIKTFVKSMKEFREVPGSR
jgi:hypothetical protein